MLLSLLFAGAAAVGPVVGAGLHLQVDAIPAAVAAAAPSAVHRGDVARRLLELLNVERMRRGLRALRADEDLAITARRFNEDMLARRFFNHASPEGQMPWDRVAAQHGQRFRTIGENIWGGTGYPWDDAEELARRIHKRWMSSRGHRANILNARYTVVGIAMTAEGDAARATQVFAKE